MTDSGYKYILQIPPSNLNTLIDYNNRLLTIDLVITAQYQVQNYCYHIIKSVTCNTFTVLCTFWEWLHDVYFTNFNQQFQSQNIFYLTRKWSLLYTIDITRDIMARHECNNTTLYLDCSSYRTRHKVFPWSGLTEITRYPGNWPYLVPQGYVYEGCGALELIGIMSIHHNFVNEWHQSAKE